MGQCISRPIDIPTFVALYDILTGSLQQTLFQDLFFFFKIFVFYICDYFLLDFTEFDWAGLELSSS